MCVCMDGYDVASEPARAISQQMPDHAHSEVIAMPRSKFTILCVIS